MCAHRPYLDEFGVRANNSFGNINIEKIISPLTCVAAAVFPQCNVIWLKVISKSDFQS